VGRSQISSWDNVHELHLYGTIQQHRRLRPDVLQRTLVRPLSQLGRFAQADSIVPGGVQGYDRYAYVNNNPLRYTDPSGHDPSGDYCDRGYCGEIYNEVFVHAGMYQQNAALCVDCNQHPRKFAEYWYPGDRFRSIGPAKITDAQMEGRYGDAASGDDDDPRGYGLGLRYPGSSTLDPDQNNDSVARVAMGRRIGLRLEACVIAGCSATDRVIVAALAANEDISAGEIIKAFANQGYWKKGIFDWDTYLDINKPNPRIRNTIIRQFIDDIDSEDRDDDVKWDSIEELIKNEDK